MAANIKEFAEMESYFAPGHGSCSGCGFPMIVRTVLKAAGKNTVACIATGCLEVTTTQYPRSSWKIPCIHSLFENAGATISGVESAYRALKKQGKIKDNINFVAFAGDGGTYDIGLQSLSGMLERGHKAVFVLYDNGAYMNTGNQRSSGTPYAAKTSTTPVGSVLKGNMLFRKDIARIAAAHNIPYAAQAAVHDWQDLFEKAKKAFAADGPAFLNVLSPCQLNWGTKTDLAIEISRLAVNTKFWPLYEIENGVWKLSYKPQTPVPISEFLKHQKRFRHLLEPENKKYLEKMQAGIDREWGLLEKQCAGEKNGV
ncbi:MAG: thiamine pyrophosphate-dependent enzyme [Candidatus Nanoarchaeia archaeon]|nr:thiamine pyrophosphate-dependent enzyme [Candidatus Nanoarchaeia archaeon]